MKCLMYMSNNELFENYYSELLSAGMDSADARATVYLLFEEIAGLDRKSFLIRGSEEMPEETKVKLDQAMQKVLCGTPVDYIIGKRWFCGLEFLVNESVLIPRQETELLVEEAVRLAGEAVTGKNHSAESDKVEEKKWNDGKSRLDFEKNQHRQLTLPDAKDCLQHTQKDTETENKGKYHILDLCTGSGCIIIAMAEMMEKEHKERSVSEMHDENQKERNATEMPQKSCEESTGTFEYFASDISEEALNTAKKNAEKFGKNIRFIKSDMFHDMDGLLFDMIVSNPPYIPDDQLLELDRKVTEHEPHMALFGGKDGLDFYRIIAKEAKKHLNPCGILLLEIGFDQGESVPELLKKEGYNNISVKKDYSGLSRIVTAYL